MAVREGVLDGSWSSARMGLKKHCCERGRTIDASCIGAMAEDSQKIVI